MTTTSLQVTIPEKKAPSQSLRDLSISLANNQRATTTRPRTTSDNLRNLSIRNANFRFADGPTKTVPGVYVNPKYAELVNQSPATPTNMPVAGSSVNKQAPITSGTYTVKQGDTLGKISRETGVPINQLSGYRSGNPDLIFPGEQITFGNKPATDTQYNDLVRDGLNENTTEESDNRAIIDYDQQLENARIKREAAFKNLENLTTTTFDREYKNRKLDKTKAEMRAIDDEIARLKSERDEAINKVRTNPGLSAAQMAGDIKKIADFQNEKINTEIMRRNSLAESYNQELKSIDRVIENAARDAQLQFGYWDSIFKEATAAKDRYNAMLREQLKSDRQQENFEKELAQQLLIAKMREASGGGRVATPRLQLITNPVTNQPLYWFNPATGEVQYPEGNTPTAGNQPTSFEDLSVETETNGSGKKWYNPFSWFR